MKFYLTSSRQFLLILPCAKLAKIVERRFEGQEYDSMDSESVCFDSISYYVTVTCYSRHDVEFRQWKKTRERVNERASE